MTLTSPPAAPAPAVADSPAWSAARLTALLRRHWLAALLVGLGLVLRLLVMVAYPRGFWVQGDSQEYLGTAFSFIPGYYRPSGYAVFLSALVNLQSTREILLVQHLIGVGLAVACYGFMLRRGVNRWIAAAAMAPLLLEARLITLEHYLLSETFFTAVVVAAVIFLLWRDRPAVWQCTAVGLMLALAAVTRSVGITLIPLVALYLIIRKLGWRQFTGFALASVIGIGLYATWYHAEHGQWQLTGYSGRFLWARTTTFMDCGTLDLTPAEAPICPEEPLDHRLTPPEYLWTKTSVAVYPNSIADPIAGGLARKAILRQPLDYLTVVVRDTWAMMLPGTPAGTMPCDYFAVQLPTNDPGGCGARYLAPPRPVTRHLVGDITAVHGPLLAPLNRYSRIVILPGGVTGLAFLFALLAAFIRARRSSLRAWLDPLLLTAMAFGMIVLSVATAAPDTRYEAPSLPLAMVGAALAWRRLGQTRTESVA